MRTIPAALVFLSLALGACGGRTSGDPGTEEAPEESEPDPSATPDPTEPGGPDTPLPGETPLGECEPGFDPTREPGRACDWLAEGRCYPTKLAACNCICPRNRTSTCGSGFPGYRSPVFCL